MEMIRKFLDRFDLDRQKARLVCTLCVIAGIIIVLFSGAFVFSATIFIVGCVLGFLISLFGCIVYRSYAPCPHCGKYIDYRHADAHFCPDCGKELD